MAYTNKEIIDFKVSDIKNAILDILNGQGLVCGYEPVYYENDKVFTYRDSEKKWLCKDGTDLVGDTFGLEDIEKLEGVINTICTGINKDIHFIPVIEQSSTYDAQQNWFIEWELTDYEVVLEKEYLK